MKLLCGAILLLLIGVGALTIEERKILLEREIAVLEDSGAGSAIAFFRKNNLCLGGLKSRYVKDSQLTSSSVYGGLESHSARHGRLDSNTGVGGWCPAENSKGDQWIQVNLYKPKTVYGLMIQGRSQIQQWVTKFKVQYGDDVNSLKYISVGSKPLVFDGATDPDTAYARRFPKPIETKFIRIVVDNFYVHPCLRFDFLEC